MGRRSRKRTRSAPAPAPERAAKLPPRPERPPGLFGRVPVSEALILIGVGLLVVGLVRGPSGAGGSALKLGVGFCAVATIELTLREHVRGFRSHTLFISLLVAGVVHIAGALIGGSDFARSPALLAADAAAFGTTAAILMRVFRSSRKSSA
jgi:hypothetical protein